MQFGAKAGIGVSLLALATMSASKASAQEVGPTKETEAESAQIVVTGSRIQRSDLNATSPVLTFGEEQIELDRAVTVEDITAKLPQFAGGVNSTQTGSDGRGAQTLDLRNLGQNRTLVLINGTRAVPFSFRNAVDVNAIPAPLLKQVDVLTGGAAAVYGADAVAGVVNFIIDTDYEGVGVGASVEFADGYRVYDTHLKLGAGIGDRGNIVAFFGYTDRGGLNIGDRQFAADNSASPVAGIGGNFTDIATGNFFAFDEAGAFTTTAQTSDLSDQYDLVQPLQRINVSTFFNYELAEPLEFYGRAMYSQVDTVGSGRSGNNPVTVNEIVGISETNPFLTSVVRDQLTFVNGVAQVRVNRTLGELGIIRAATDRTTIQFLGGFRGDLTDWLSYDAYAQYGEVDEESVISGDALRVNASGASRFAAIANSVDIFGPGADLSGFGQDFSQERRNRKQTVGAITLSGDSSALFSLPGGPIKFSVGYEYRKETLETSDEAAVASGLTFRTTGGGVTVGDFDVNELYGEILVPILADKPFFKNVTAEGALRYSDYSNFDPEWTYKLGLSWEVDYGLRLRGTYQSVIRAPNLGEFASPTFSIPFSLLRTVPRLAPRYLGDPCELGTGDRAQCDRFGAPAAGSYDSLDPANLTGDYFFGGNPDIGPETGKTWTLGAVFTPDFFDGFELFVDYYDIKIRDAVGQIQPVDALQSCYIENPVADNPICAAISRDPVTGFIDNAFVNDRNLGVIKQRGFDINTSYTYEFGSEGLFDQVSLSYQANIVTGYSIQRNPVLSPIDCKGTFGFACSSDAVSLVQPDYRHRLALSTGGDSVLAQVVWRRIGEVTFAGGTDEQIDAMNYIDLNFRWTTPLDGLVLNAGVRNLFDVGPPLPNAAGAFGTYPGTYDVIGRTFGIAASIDF